MGATVVSPHGLPVSDSMRQSGVVRRERTRHSPSATQEEVRACPSLCGDTAEGVGGGARGTRDRPCRVRDAIGTRHYSRRTEKTHVAVVPPNSP